MSFRLLEGEAVLYRGVVYLVKGFQHPEGKLVAYPRYDAVSLRKLHPWERRGAHEEIFWECIKRPIPVVPVDSSSLFFHAQCSPHGEAIRSLLESLLDKEVYLTGSALVSCEHRDLDFVVYGADSSTVEKLEELSQRGILKTEQSIIVNEYFEKHKEYMRLEDYLRLKEGTLLHFRLQGHHVNLKLVEHRHGLFGCIDPVVDYTSYTGVVNIQKPINPRIIPARYESVLNEEPVILETLRELYAELKPGFYYALNTRVETRRSGMYLVPDSGVLLPLKTS